MDSPLRPVDRPSWQILSPGTLIDIVKLGPDGQEITRYPGTVLNPGSNPEWLVAEAWWTRDSLKMAGLHFVTGDRLLEYFSPRHPFDAFAVFSPDDTLRGWYANVTWPSWMDLDGERPALYWHDLCVDLVALPDGNYTVLDEDELARAIVSPVTRTMIEQARDELINRFLAGQPPFADRLT